MPRKVRAKGPEKTDVHGIEVRPGLVLVFHRTGIPAERAVAAVRASLGSEYELLPVRTDPETIPLIEEAMLRRGDAPEHMPPFVPTPGRGESN